MRSGDIRRAFTDFFVAREHRPIPSSSLIPHGDPTLLFTSAGMVQFKPYFMGLADPPGSRLTSVQKCFRTSDVDKVGNYGHLTFFEMLGNFSVGDYFKDEAIAWAWELVTREINLAPDRLWATVFVDDDEAFELWRKQGVPADRIMRYGEDENYWFSGETGPCGPCSEIHYDFGPEAGCGQPDCQPSHTCGRFVELWNLVFMTYYQQEDGARTPLPKKNIDTGAGLERWAVVLQGKDNVYDTDLFRPLVARVEEISGRDYDGAEEATRRAMRVVAEHARAAAFLIADGVVPGNEGRGYVLRRLLRRAVYFANRLGDGGRAWIRPVSESVIELMAETYPELAERRQFIERVVEAEEEKFRQTLEAGLRHLQADLVEWRRPLVVQLEEIEQAVEAPLRLLQLPGAIISALQTAGPKIDALQQAALEQTSGPIQKAVESTAQTALAPLHEVREHLAEIASGGGSALQSALREALAVALPASRQVSGREAFVLHDTYGFPKELTAEVAAEHGFTLDEEGFEKEMAVQRERSRAGVQFRETVGLRGEVSATLTVGPTQFVGYDTLTTDTTVSRLIAGDEAAEVLEAGQSGAILLEKTPFYAESGGQVGDTGTIRTENGLFAVDDTRRVDKALIIALGPGQSMLVPEGRILHFGRVIEGRIAHRDEVIAEVDATRRADTMRNHTATHLLHAALRQVLGQHVRQAGSLVAPDRLRFDFTHIEAPKPEQIDEIQRIVNEKICEDLPMETRHAAYEEAIAEGAMALFGEKYAAQVRVVEVGEPGVDQPVSMELCGGTHCERTGQVGTFLILSEGSIGAGLRRIEALTGRAAEEYIRERLGILERVSHRLGAAPTDLEKKLDALTRELDTLHKRVQALERAAGRRAVEPLLSQAEKVNSTSILAARVSASSFEAMREMGDWLRDRLGSAVVVLGAVFSDRPNFLAMVTRDLTAKGIDAGELIKEVAALTGGGGGGRPEMAQAGGKDVGRLDEALKLATSLAREALANAQGAGSDRMGDRS